MRKKLLSAALSLVLLLALVPTAAYAAAYDANSAAQSLYQLGLFSGVDKDAEGNPNFDLDRAPTRYEAVTMLVRLLGKADEAVSGTWDTPFTDVAEWAKPYVGYAYAHDLTSGTSATTFGGAGIVTPVQYITFVLRALGYESGTDFQWNKSYELSNELGFTVEGVYNEWGTYDIEKSTSGDARWNLRDFVRGDMALISNSALFINIKGTGTTLLEQIMSTPGAGEHTHSYKTYQIPHYGQAQIGTAETVEYTQFELYVCGYCSWSTEDYSELQAHLSLGYGPLSRPCAGANHIVRYGKHPSISEQPIYKTQWVETTVHICKTCGQQEDLTNHIHDYITKTGDRYEQVQVKSNTVTVYDNVWAYTCNNCKKTTTNFEELKAHIAPNGACPGSRYGGSIKSQLVKIIDEPVYEIQWVENTFRVCSVCGQREP